MARPPPRAVVGPARVVIEEIGPIQLAEIDGGFGDRLEPASPPHVQ
jgi:hypothetical protein